MSEKYSQSHTDAILGELRQKPSLGSSAPPASSDAPLDLDALRAAAERTTEGYWGQWMERASSHPRQFLALISRLEKAEADLEEACDWINAEEANLERAEAALAELQEAISFGPWGQKSDAAILLRWAEDMERKYGGERAVTRWLRKVSAALATPAPGEGETCTQ